MSAKIEPTNKSEESVWDLVKVILQALLIAFVVTQLLLSAVQYSLRLDDPELC